ncbi:MAG: hypothetical protein ABJA80_04030 [bacterium]
MKLNQVKAKCLSAATADALTTAIEAFLLDPAVSEATFLSIEYSAVTGMFSALIVYAT